MSSTTPPQQSQSRTMQKALLMIVLVISMALDFLIPGSSFYSAPVVLAVCLSALYSDRWFHITAGIAIVFSLVPLLLWLDGSIIRRLISAACILLIVYLRAQLVKPNPRLAESKYGENGSAERLSGLESDTAKFDSKYSNSSTVDYGVSKKGEDGSSVSSRNFEINLPPPFIDRLAETGNFTQAQLLEIYNEWSLDNEEYSFVHDPFDESIPIGDSGDSHLPLRLGKYQLTSLISKGGAGSVFRAINLKTDEIVAIKVLTSKRMSQRFEREMDLIQRLAHPNIVFAYDVGVFKKSLYIVMELVDGIDLHRLTAQKGLLPYEDVINYVLQAARALQHIHERDLLHRDVKPANLLLESNGTVKLADLGLAICIDEQDDSKFATKDHTIVGTLNFMSPEQAESLHNTDERSDIFSLGSTFYYLLTGRIRLRGSNLKERFMNLLGNRVCMNLPSHIPRAIALVVEKSVEHDPINRYQSAAEFVVALERLAEEFSIDDQKHQLNVLVVEDTEEDMYITIETLKRLNPSIKSIEVQSLNESIYVCRRRDDIDMVLLDLNLPDSSGVQTVEKFCAAIPKTPVVVLTGMDDSEIGDQCVQAGADAYVSKKMLGNDELERLLFVTYSRHRSQSAPSR